MVHEWKGKSVRMWVHKLWEGQTDRQTHLPRSQATTGSFSASPLRAQCLHLAISSMSRSACEGGGVWVCVCGVYTWRGRYMYSVRCSLDRSVYTAVQHRKSSSPCPALTVTLSVRWISGVNYEVGIIGQWYKFVPFGLTFSAFFLSFTISSRLGIVPPSQPIFERLTHSEQRNHKMY